MADQPEPVPEAQAVPEAEAAASPSHQALPLHPRARLVGRTVLTVLLLGAAIWIAMDFLPALAWAAVIAITVWPLYRRVAPVAPPDANAPALVPLVCTLLVGVLISVPLVLAVHRLGMESDSIVRGIGRLQESGVPVPDWVGRLPLAGDQIADWWRARLSDPGSFSKLFGNMNAETFTSWTTALGGDLLHRLAMFFVMLLALFFFLRDGAAIAGEVLETAERLLGHPGERLTDEMVEAVRGTVNGTVLVALAEGVIIGIGYMVAGVPNPVLFAVITAAFAMLPFGAWAAFTAAALFLLLQGGSPLAAASVWGFGAAVMLVGDNFVWPMLVGSTARLPFMLAMVGIFGGVQVFGLIGLFLGPVIMAALLTIWREWIVARRSSG